MDSLRHLMLIFCIVIHPRLAMDLEALTRSSRGSYFCTYPTRRLCSVNAVTCSRQKAESYLLMISYMLNHFTKEQERSLKEDVYCADLPTQDEYIKQLEDCGFPISEFEDRTEAWTKYVNDRAKEFVELVKGLQRSMVGLRMNTCFIFIRLLSIYLILAILGAFVFLQRRILDCLCHVVMYECASKS